ncbi:hypothetical protein [uncultured Parabacteroides sp.]|uniref:hypothetical protein n=1 Tax=uncultured Parabacteroides sp. TaxID=512312 RepID=UPI0028049E3E|nr:hypothetical protein [uncultured Parabacteroides sp.]
MKELLLFIVIFVILFRIGIKLQRWINGTDKIAKNQKKLLDELKKREEKHSN